MFCGIWRSHNWSIEPGANVGERCSALSIRCSGGNSRAFQSLTRMLGSGLSKARHPWRTAANGVDVDHVRRDALAHAILAPSAHNMQPWIIELVGDTGIRLLPDLSKFTPEIDPPNRQMTISYGAFLELLRQAASVRGYTADVTVFPDGVDETRLDHRSIADVTLRPGGVASDPLASTIIWRRTNRDAFDADHPVPDETMQEVVATVTQQEVELRWTSDTVTVERLRTLGKEGWVIETKKEATSSESAEVTRIGADEVNATPDGLSFYGIGIETLRLFGLMSREKIATDGTTAKNQVIKSYNGAIDGTATFAWLVSRDNSRATQLAAGAAWVRTNQAANLAGVSMHPISQVIEEFPEMADKFRDVHALLEIREPARIQGIFRLGYAPTPEPAPRWPLADKIASR
jgi:hypothetical protein